MSLLSFINRNILSIVVSCVVLSWSDQFLLFLLYELVPMSQPANHSRNHEKHWEHVSWKPECFVDDAAIEINVWVKFLSIKY